MKKFSGILLTGLLSLGQVQAEAFKAPDILVDSKLDYDWTGVLVSKFRMLLKNYKMNDPFSGRYTQPVLLNESKVGEFLPEDSKTLIRDFGNAVGLNFINAETKVWMEGLNYDVKGFQSNIKASDASADGIVIGTDFAASEVYLSADKLSLSLVIPGKTNSPVFSVSVIKPYIRAKEEKLITFFTKIKIKDQKDHYKLQIVEANFDKMANRLVKNPDDIELDYEKIVIPKVSLKVGNKTINFSQEKIEGLIRSNHAAIKGMLLAQAATSLRSNTTEAAFKVLEQYKLNKEYWVGSPVLKSQIQIGAFGSSESGESIEIHLPGDFCTNEKFDKLQGQCVNNKTTQVSPTRLTKQAHDRSVTLMKEMMEEGNANFVASISEDYLNKLLVTTYDAGLWKQTLDEAGVELGPNKVTMRMDKKGDSATLIMDVVYKPTKVEKLLTGSKVIRFPLVLDVSVKIEKHDGEPVVLVRFNDVDTTDETLINGRPADNIISTVREVPRFKGKVAKAIREKISVLRNKDVFELRYPELKGVGLEKVDFLSDGNGRMHAVMRLEDLIAAESEE